MSQLSILRKFIYVLVATMVSFNSMSMASQPIHSTFYSPGTLALVQNFQSVHDFFRFADAILPGKGFDQWAIKATNLPAVSLGEAHFEGAKLYIEGVKEAFEFSNDGVTVSYKGVAVSFKPGVNAEETIQKAEKAWGGFRELSPRKGSHSIFELLMPAKAFADGGKEATKQVIKGTLTNIAGMIVAVAAVSVGAVAISTVGLAVAGVGAAYALYGMGKSIYFMFDKKANFVKDAKLSCTKAGEPQLKHQSATQLEWVHLSQKEVDKVMAALRQICQKPEAVESFNQSLFNLKKKIFSGEGDFFAKEAAAKTPLGDPMGIGAPGAN